MNIWSCSGSLFLQLLQPWSLVHPCRSFIHFWKIWPSGCQFSKGNSQNAFSWNIQLLSLLSICFCLITGLISPSLCSQVSQVLASESFISSASDSRISSQEGMLESKNVAIYNKYWIATLFSTNMKAVHKSKAQEWSWQTAFAASDARSPISLYNILWYISTILYYIWYP